MAEHRPPAIYAQMSSQAPQLPGASPEPQAAPNSQRPEHPSFRCQRASRACQTCHARKVRCDAVSLGIPCTNCIAFSIECKIPTTKRRKTGTGKQKKSESDRGETDDFPRNDSPRNDSPGGGVPLSTTSLNPTDGTPVTSLTEAQSRQQGQDHQAYAQSMKPKFARPPINEVGRVAYLGESSNLTLLVHDRHGTADVVHYPLPENVRGSRARLTELNNVEINILRQRGAFILPSKALCDEIVDSYFKWVAPIIPVINRSRFMRQYRDLKNPPSLLLLQAILLAGSRVCTNPQLRDANGSTTPAALKFYKRAKALYDAEYEDNPVTIVQALVLMGWYWESPEDVTKNVFHWSRVATIVAQESGMHRSVEGSQVSTADRRLWKRIWWTLFTRDRSIAVTLGRPVHINTDNSDVEMVSDDDFIEDEGDGTAKFTQDPVHVQFFLQYVKLCEVMGLVLSQKYSVASKARHQNAIDLTHSDMALADWLQDCPKEVYWEMPRHHFWSALLHSNYYSTLCLLHRAHMPPATNVRGGHKDNVYQSQNIAFQAAAMITSIVENLSAHNELRYCPTFIVDSLFLALITHIYQMRSSVSSVVEATQERIRVCMNALKDISSVWLVAKIVYTLCESILGKNLSEKRLQKAADNRQKMMVQSLAQGINQAHIKREDPRKRKYDDMALGLNVNNGPALQKSYERLRPQTPSQTGSPMSAPPISSPNPRPSPDTFIGRTNSRPQTLPPTPFTSLFSIQATPPDMYHVTRNSPNLSHSIWGSFQPDQPFPENSANMHQNQLSPSQTDTNLGFSLLPQMGVTPQMPNQSQPSQSPHQRVRGSVGSPPVPNMLLSDQTGPAGYQVQAGMWQGNIDQPMHIAQGQSPSGAWSNASAQAVPMTMNVGDWFQFFGINGDVPLA